MKRYFYLLMITVCLNVTAKAAPGDTTWVHANFDSLSWYGNYDTTITFPSPGTTYRKIYMIFTLGKYMCPAGSTYCGDWDYTVQNFLMTPGGDTLELGRLITPYANAAAPRTPWTWQQRYVFDVTDYAAVLQNTASMRIFYSGYSGGFTANVQFAFIEGIPDRNVLGIRKLWNGSYTYGDTVGGDVNDINTHFTPISATAPTGTVSTDLKFTVTGHGSDTINQCCEFASHNYQVMLNASSVASYQMWRDNCSLNELYPQSGTWLLERGNWCPGALVYSNFHPLPGIASGSSFNIGIKFDAYQERPSSVSYGIYTTFGTLIYYGGINKTLDASIEEIIAPTNNENHFRENPIVGTPTLHIRNSGSTVINSIQFQYGIQDSVLQTYTWVGTLNPLQDTDIDLAALTMLNTIAGTSGVYNFIAEILSVNGVTDNDQTNDTMRSQFISAPKWPVSFRVFTYTSDINDSINTSIAQTSWVIHDMYNTVVKQETNLGLNTHYTDTLLNLSTGYYRLDIVNTPYEDGNYYGLQWWALAGAGYTPGYFRVEQLTSGATIPMNGYSYSGTYNNDFGQGFTQYFYVYNAATVGVQNVTANSAGIEVFPNPAQNFVNVDITGLQQVNGTVQILDALGRVVAQTSCNSADLRISTSGLANGVYNVLFISEGSENKLQSKLLILK